MGIELELGTLLVFAIIGQSSFARFEIETPVLRKILKWLSLSALTLLLYRYVGHWALVLPSTIGVVGATFHLVWCKRHGIDPLRATPSRRLLRTQGVEVAGCRQWRQAERTYRTMTGTSARTGCFCGEPFIDASRSNRPRYLPGVAVTIPVTL